MSPNKKSQQATRCRWGFFFLGIVLFILNQPVLSSELDPSAVHNKAVALLKEQQYLEALLLFEDILTRNPSYIEGYRAVVTCYDAMGDRQGAAVFIESLFLENPDNAGANYAMGYSHFHQKKYEAAAAYFDKAIQLNPDLAEAWNNRAAIFQIVDKNDDKARQYYKKAIDVALKSGNTRVIEIAQNNLVHIPQKEIPKPVTEQMTLEAFLNRFVDAVAENDTARIKALVLGQRQNSEDAMQWLVEQGMRASVQNATKEEAKALGLAQVLADFYEEFFNSGLLTDKLQNYRGLSAHHKQLYVEGEARLQEGATLEENLQFQQAVAAYQTSLNCFQEIGDRQKAGIAYVYLGDVYAKTEEFASACQAYQNGLTSLRVIGDTRKMAQVLASSGSACYHAGRYDCALRFLNQSLVLYREIHDEASEKKLEQNIQLVQKKME